MARVLSIFVTICVLFQAAWGAARKHNLGVTGGNAIPIESAPYMTLLYTGGDLPCGGIIVSAKYILTSATCCEDSKWSAGRWIARIGTDGTPRSRGYYVKIKDFVRYPDSGLKTNLCLVKLSEALAWNSKVQEIALDHGELLEANLSVTLTAFGRTSKLTIDNAIGMGILVSTASDDDESHKRELRQVTLPIDDSNWCKQDIKRLGFSILCAGNETRNACFGDAGGALTSNGFLIGVISDVPPDCVSRASRFSRITYYRQWIESETLKP